ncbi:hypothetical protein Sjap_016301 [Stephania japonica]|uniref:Cytochrome P450 n=1 Tax=Stephania japonica TaxID=461633 RepID=A0AAP0NTC7_9MAGN
MVTRYNYKGTSLQTSNLPPSPPKLPLIGNVHQIGTLAHRSLRDLSQKYGPIMLLHFGRTPVVVVSSRDMAREIVKNYDIVFANRPFTRGATTLLYNCKDVAFAPYGEYWRNMRKICIMKLFTAKKVQSFKFVREEEVGIMVEKISHSSLSGTPINLSETVLTLAKDVISRCSLGKKYGEEGDKRLEVLTREVSVLMGAFCFQDVFPALGWMDVVTGLVARMKRTAQNLDTLLDLVIEKHIAARDDKFRKDDFVDLLLQGQEEQKLDIYLTKDGIKAIILGSSLQTSNLPPSPPKFPFIGNLHQLGTLAHRSLRDLSRKYGPTMLLHFGRTPVAVVSSSDMAREIIKNHDIIFANRPFTRAATTLLYNCSDIAFAPYGESWRNMRKICVMKLFSTKKVQSFKFVREEEVGIMVEKISHSSLSGTPINLSETVLTLAKDVISRCSLGKKYGEEGDKRLERLTREVTVLMGAFSFQDFFPALGWMDVVIGLVARMKRTAQTLDTLLDQVIEKHIAARDEGFREDVFVDLLLHGQKEQQKLDIDLSRNGIKAIILDVLIAGIETTATTIEWGMAELLKNRTAMKKAQDEVRRVVGINRKINEEGIKQMDYLMCVIKETLRLHPVVPTLLPRQSYASTNVGGYEIPSRTWLLINVWAIQRDPELWTQPEEFIPERFIGKSIDFKGQDFEFIPFGCGRRICLGMSLGVATVEYAMANLLYWFDWELPCNDIASKDGEVDMREDYGLSLRKKTPVHVVPTLHFP